MYFRALAFVAICLCSHAFARAADLPDYVRYTEDADAARLEVAIRSFTLPSGQRVDLIGAIHIADRSYYQDLNGRFAAYDAVLFELVGDPEGLTRTAPVEGAQEIRPGGGAVGFVQQAASRYLDLTFQLNAVDYTGKNMVHADLSFEEFQSLQAARGESMATMFVRAMQAQSSGAMNSAMRELDTFGLLRILVSPDSAAAFKKALAKTFDQMETMTAAMEGPEGSAILGARNDVALKKLKEVLANRKMQRVAVFYGGAHMPGIEISLTRDLGATASGEQWLAAWTMLKPAPATAPAPVTAPPASGQARPGS